MQRLNTNPRVAWVRWALVGAAAVLAVVAIGYAIVRPPARFHAEGGPLEIMQVGVWALAAAVGLAGAIVNRAPRQRWWLLWLAVLAAMCAARELDLHVLANPEHAGAWGVRYRLDWWMSASAPVWPRIVWAGAFLAIASLLLIPPLRARLNAAVILQGLRTQYGPFWLLGIAAACMGLGWVADDLLRPLRHIYTEIQPVSQGVEETVELCGPTAFLGAVWLSLRNPLP